MPELWVGEELEPVVTVELFQPLFLEVVFDVLDRLVLRNLDLQSRIVIDLHHQLPGVLTFRQQLNKELV